MVNQHALGLVLGILPLVLCLVGHHVLLHGVRRRVLPVTGRRRVRVISVLRRV